ncbi:MAG: Calx-beta domain-containing protein [Vicinamibacterales bacterium]
MRKWVFGTAMLAMVVAAGGGVRGQGGSPAPILVVVNDSAPNPFGSYLPEILRAEGINAFAVVQLSALDAPTLGAAALVVLAETPLTAPQATLFTDYVGGGGRLVAMRPDAQLHGVLGVAAAAGTTTDGYLLVDQSGPGAGLQNLTLPFKGPADHYDPAGGVAVADLYSTRTVSAGRPAVVRQARTAAWAFDLARSTAYARQGDPAFAGLDRDGLAGYRTNDIFFQTIDLDRVGVPHADVQMRLLTRVITDLLADATPLPRLWYFPGASRTIVIPTSDSHTSLPGPYAALLAAAESVGARVTLYMSRFIDPAALPIAAWEAAGHEVALHPHFTEDGLTGNFPQGYTNALTWFQSFVPVPPGATVRHHTLEWGGWIDPVATMPGFGVRMDLSSYSWGPALDQPALPLQAHGYLTGSGLPMRFIDSTGQVQPVYQQYTALTDEQLVFGSHSQGLSPGAATAVSRSLIDASQAGGYSAIATHVTAEYYPFGEVGPWVDATLAYAANLHLPMWPAGRWLRFVEARTATTITDVAWTPATGVLTFSIDVPAGAEPQSLLLPQSFAGRVIAHAALDGATRPTIALAVNGRAMQVLEVAALGGGGARQVEVLYALASTLPVLSVNDISVIEGQTGTTPATVTVSLSAPSATAVTLTYSTSDGTAVAGLDYQAATGSLTLAAGATSAPLTVQVLGDTVDEPLETLVVTLGNPIGATLGDNAAVVAIQDDDPDPLDWTDTAAADFAVCSVTTGTRVGSIGDVRLPGVFHDTFDGPTLDPRWTAESAGGGPIGLVPSGGRIGVAGPAGAFIRSVAPVPAGLIDVRASFAAAPHQAIGIADDTFFTRFALFSTLADGSDLWARTDPGTGEIRTNLGPVPAGFHDFAIERLEQGDSELVRYWLDGDLVAAHLVPAGGLPAARFVHLSNRGPGGPPLEVETIDAAQPYESPGDFLSCPVDASFVMNWDRLYWEADLPTGTSVSFRTRSSIDGATWSVWSAPFTVSGTAIGNPPGRYLQYAIVLTSSDSANSPVVRSVTAAALGPATPMVSIGDAAAVESAGALSFTAALSWPSPSTVTVDATTAAGTAQAGVDFVATSETLTFPTGLTTRPFVVTLINDVLDEGSETFSAVLSAPVGATLGAPVGVGTIVDDDRLPTAVADAFATAFETPLDVAAPGVLGNDDDGGAGLTAVLVSSVAHGTLGLGPDGSVHYTPTAGFAGTDTFTYRATTVVGDSNVVTVTITVAQPTVVQAPSQLRVADVSGNLITFRWRPPAVGPAPSGYVVEGGVAPGQPLVALAAGPAPVFSVTAPTGSFYARVRALGVGGPSEVSNEILLHVGVPVPPSAPAAFQASVVGSTVHLAWTPTHAGGAAAGFLLDVTGSTAASVPLPVGEGVAVTGAPAGVFTLSLRAVNGAGSSPGTAPVPIVVPGACGAAPGAPTELLGYAAGGATHLLWDPPTTGGAVSSYLVSVPGIGSLPLAQRAISGPLPPGTYTIAVHAVGPCGTSVAATTTVTVP